MQTRTALWVRLAIVNLCIVALLGVIMRYKIGFSFPYLNQKFLQEAHSHFAFTGWITHTLFFLLEAALNRNLGSIRNKAYALLIGANLVCAYGMLGAFLVQGYGAVSIFFSAASMLVSYIFSFFALRDIARLPGSHPGKKWFWGAVWFGIFSTFGTMVLSYMMATKQYDQATYLGSIYFYLHFQYNGWFLFACMGLLLDWCQRLPLDLKWLNRSFWLFFIAGVPTFFLSTLWADLPGWLYVLVVTASIAQFIGWLYFLRVMAANFKGIKSMMPKGTGILLLTVGAALTLKMLLQLGSTIPELSHLAFGFRPIVIAYLHLVLLLIVTYFLLVFLFSSNRLPHTRTSRAALFAFGIGAVLNEVILAVQGIAAFSYTVIPFANEALFGAALVLLISTVVILATYTTKPIINDLMPDEQDHLLA